MDSEYPFSIRLLIIKARSIRLVILIIAALIVIGTDMDRMRFLISLFFNKLSFCPELTLVILIFEQMRR